MRVARGRNVFLIYQRVGCGMRSTPKPHLKLAITVKHYIHMWTVIWCWGCVGPQTWSFPPVASHPPHAVAPHPHVVWSGFLRLNAMPLGERGGGGGGPPHPRSVLLICRRLSFFYGAGGIFQFIWRKPNNLFLKASLLPRLVNSGWHFLQCNN